MHSKRVLIAEDSENIRELLAQVLQEKGFEVYYAGTGLDAAELCKKEHFHYLFLSTQLPDMREGHSVLDEIKRLEPNIKIILISGRAEEATVMRYMERANGYLRKPFGIDDIDIVLQGNAKRKRL